MAFNSTEGRAEYTATAGQTVFPFAFKIFDDSNIKVYLTPSGQDADDTTDILILTTDYTATVNGDSGGDLTLVSPASDGDAVTIIRQLPVDRLVEYQKRGDLLADTLNLDQDYQTYLVADQKDSSSRHITLSDAVQGVSAVLPNPEANRYLRWNDTEDALINGDPVPTGGGGVYVRIDNTSTEGQTIVDATPYNTDTAQFYLNGTVLTLGVDYTASSGIITLVKPMELGDEYSAIVQQDLALGAGASGTFTTADAKTVTVLNGLIISIV